MEKHQNIKNWSEDVIVTYVISDLNDKEIIGTFYEIDLQKAN